MRDQEAEPARSPHRFALIDRQLLRQGGVCREQPAAEIGTRRARSRILDHRIVLAEEKTRGEPDNLDVRIAGLIFLQRRRDGGV